MFPLLTACAPASSDSSCGVLFEYSNEFQDKAANQVEKIRQLEEYKELSKMIEDYGDTRQTIRDCIVVRAKYK